MLSRTFEVSPDRFDHEVSGGRRHEGHLHVSVPHEGVQVVEDDVGGGGRFGHLTGDLFVPDENQNERESARGSEDTLDDERP